MHRFAKSDKGASAVAYAITVGLIALAGFLALTGFGERTASVYTAATAALGDDDNSGTPPDDGDENTPPEEAGNTAPVIVTTALPNATEGIAYSFQMTASDADNDVLTWSAESMPAGLAISDSGLFSGVPTEQGVFNPIFTVTDGNGGSDSVALALEIEPNGQCVSGTQTFASSHAGPWYQLPEDPTFRGTWQMPDNCTILTIEVAGAGGFSYGGNNNRTGGAGGRIIVEYPNVAPGQIFHIVAGAHPWRDATRRYHAGLSGVFLGTYMDRANALVVAGGGGSTGAVANAWGGAGGGANQAGTNGNGTYGGRAGNVSSPGAANGAGSNPGVGFVGGDSNSGSFAGNGGGGGFGWYGAGGGGSNASNNGGGGGGGSGYADLDRVIVLESVRGGGASTTIPLESVGAEGNGWVTLTWE